ncbi:MAG: hypothetical protein IKR73_06345, partial [Oscillospiraceae bacterium]|nr:hypothetical protein [Oscillospiraceae bacterium]
MTCKKALALAASVAMLTSVFGGCQSKTDGNTGTSSVVTDQATMSKELAYTVSMVNAPTGYTVSSLTYNKGDYYAACSSEGETERKVSVIVFGSDSQLKKEIVVSQGDPESSGGISGSPMVDDAGNVTVLYTEQVIDDAGQPGFSASIVTYDANGQQTNAVDISDVIGES